MELPPDFDARHFWADSDYALQAHTEPPPSDELIARVEADLGYRLPAFYVALMWVRNGGVSVNTRFPTTEASAQLRGLCARPAPGFRLQRIAA